MVGKKYEEEGIIKAGSRYLLSWLLMHLLGTLKHCVWCSHDGSRLCLLCCSSMSQKSPHLNIDSVFTSCMACRQIEEQAVHRTNSALHGYQQQLVECVSQGQNHIIVAPTGSGKTRVAVEVAGLLFQRKPSARILFLTPTVVLAEQQTGQHLAVCPGQGRLAGVT